MTEIKPTESPLVAAVANIPGMDMDPKRKKREQSKLDEQFQKGNPEDYDATAKVRTNEPKKRHIADR